jgi:hypothetical protein
MPTIKPDLFWGKQGVLAIFRSGVIPPILLQTRFSEGSDEQKFFKKSEKLTDKFFWFQLFYNHRRSLLFILT